MKPVIRVARRFVTYRDYGEYMSREEQMAILDETGSIYSYDSRTVEQFRKVCELYAGVDLVVMPDIEQTHDMNPRGTI